MEVKYTSGKLKRGGERPYSYFVERGQEFVKQNKTKCAMPFNHMAVRPNGTIFPCCYWSWDANDLTEAADLNIDHPDPFNHPYMKKVRQKMLNNEYVDGCKRCYKDEEITGTSMRVQMAEQGYYEGLDYVHEGGDIKLTNMDISISNACNNKCRMCGPELSTQWYGDAKKLGWGEFFDISGIKSNPLLDRDLSELKHVKLLGGEPLMEQKQIIKILSQVDLSQFTMKLVTNTTLLPSDELMSYLSQCRQLSIDLSVDAYGELNSFLRKNSKWPEVNKNIDWWIETAKKYEWEINYASVISIYNCNKMMEFIEYLTGKGILGHFHLINGPAYMRPRNLPEDCKPKLKEQLESELAIVSQYRDGSQDYLTDIYKQVLNELDQKGSFGYFVEQDLMMAKVRNEHYIDVNPELFELMYGFLPKR